MPKRTRPTTGKPILASSRLARCLGIGGLCVCSRCQKSGEVASTNRATCDTRGKDCGAEYRVGSRAASLEIIFIQDYRPAGIDWSSDGGGAHFRFQFLRLLRVVAVADSLPEQVARLGQKDSCGI